MTATIATDARTLVTAGADTSATASRGHWCSGDLTVTITRRRLASGLVRVRITVQSINYQRWAGGRGPAVTEFRDLPAAEADAQFARQLARYDEWYLARLPRAARRNPKKWLALAA